VLPLLRHEVVGKAQVVAEAAAQEKVEPEALTLEVARNQLSRELKASETNS